MLPHKDAPLLCDSLAYFQIILHDSNLNFIHSFYLFWQDHINNCLMWQKERNLFFELQSCRGHCTEARLELQQCGQTGE